MAGWKDALVKKDILGRAIEAIGGYNLVKSLQCFVAKCFEREVRGDYNSNSAVFADNWPEKTTSADLFRASDHERAALEFVNIRS